MAQPRGRRGPGRGNARSQGRGGGYSNRPSRGPARGRSNGGYGRQAGANSQMPLYLGLGAAAVVLIVVIVILATSGGDKKPKGGDEVVANHNTNQPEDPGPGIQPEPGAPALADTPLTRDEVAEIRRRIDQIESRYDYAKARQLVKDGQAAMDAGDNTQAHIHWNKAERILHPMVEESNRVFEDYGGLDGVERAIRWASTSKSKADKWEYERSLYLKFLRKD